MIDQTVPQDADAIGSARTQDAAEANTLTAPTAAETPSAPLQPEHPGRYRLLQELGRGGMGRVTLALDGQLGREVAVKELLAAGIDGSSATAVARFLREARVTGQLQHPAIVPVYELGQRSDGTIYYTMKLIRGRSLAQALAGARTLPERLRLLTSFVAVCQAVAYAHDRGVIHRDLKPDNVMVGEFGETLVLDWGIAKLRGESPSQRDDDGDARLRLDAIANHTVDGHAIGTPSYMSPEQARGDIRAIDERSDVWGLGAMLFELLTGRAPYEGSTAIELLSKVLIGPPPPVRSVLRDVPVELAAIADRALQYDPTRRYPSAQLLAADVTAWRDGAQVGAYRYSSWELLQRFVRRNRVVSIASAVVLAAILATTGIVYRGLRVERAARQRAAQSDRAARDAFADALLEKAQRSADGGDPAAAAVYATSVLASLPPAPPLGGLGLQDPAGHVARERIDRSLALLADAREATGWIFERTLQNVPLRSAISADGQRFASPSPEGVRWGRLDDDAHATLLPGPAVHTVVGFVDENRVVVLGERGGLVDLRTGRYEYTLPDALAADLAGETLAIRTASGALQVLDATTGQVRSTATTTPSHQASLVIDAGARRIATWHRGTSEIQVFDLPLDVARGPRTLAVGAPRRAAFSPEGRRLAVASIGGGVTVLDVEHPEAPAGVALRAAGGGNVAWVSPELLASTEVLGTITLLDTTTGEPVETLHVTSSTASQLYVRGDRLIYLSSGERGAGSIFARRPVHGPQIVTFPHTVFRLYDDPERARVLVAMDADLYAVPLQRDGFGAAQRIVRLSPEVGTAASLVVLPDGSIVVMNVEGSLFLLGTDGTTRTLVRTDSGGSIFFLAPLDFDRRQRLVYFASPGGTEIRRVRVADGTNLPALPGTTATMSLTINPAGTLLAAAGRDRAVRLWDLSQEPPRIVRVLEGHGALASDAQFSPDGARLATADGVGVVRVFSVATGALLAAEQVHADWVNRVAWSADGALIGTSSDDGSFRVLDGVTLRSLRILRRDGLRESVAFTSDSVRVLWCDKRSLRMSIARPEAHPSDPARLLREAEQSAGARLQGLRLVPIEAAP